MMLKCLLAVALLASATALPSPDATVPEMVMAESKTQMSKAAKAAKAAKETISKMLETGSSDSACAELATTAMKEVTDSVAAQQEAVDAFKAPNDGSACLEEGKGAVDAAKAALEKAKTDASDAAAASTAAASAPVDIGPISLGSFLEHDGHACVPLTSDPAYETAKHAAASAADVAASTAAAVPGAEAAVTSAEEAAAIAVKECQCKVYTDYTEAVATAESHKEANEATWTKGKHMECVLAGTAADACDVGTIPSVTPPTLAEGATAAACPTDTPTPNPTPNPTPHPTPPPTPSPTEPTSGVKLEGGGSSGRLLVYMNGQWGTVCDDHFDSNSNGAQVACRAMGMSGGRFIRSGGDESYPIWMDDVQCTGSESSLHDCPQWHGHGHPVTNCGHGEDSNIECHSGNELKIEEGGSSGRLMVFMNGQWGTVCDDHFDSNANGATVACKQMGYSGGSFWKSGGPENAPIWMDDVQCTGSEASLSACPQWHGHGSPVTNCGHGEDSYIQCH